MLLYINILISMQSYATLVELQRQLWSREDNRYIKALINVLIMFELSSIIATILRAIPHWMNSKVIYMFDIYKSLQILYGYPTSSSTISEPR